MSGGVLRDAFEKLKYQLNALFEEGGQKLTFILIVLFVALLIGIATAMSSLMRITDTSLTNTTQSYDILIQKHVSEQEETLPASLNESAESSITIRSDSETQVTSSPDSGVSAEVVVNGTPVDVPSEGTVQTDVVTDEGTVKVDISVGSETQGESNSSSTIDIDISSRSEIETHEE